MKEIKLTQGRVALVDDEDYEKLNQWKWCVYRCKHLFYAGRSISTGGRNQTTIKMHQVILRKMPNGYITDHKNGNGLDNQKCNLRFVTFRQNCQNYTNIKKTSKFPGVSWSKQTKKWVAHIKVNGKSKNLGYFIAETDAFNAYKQAVEALGETVIGDY